MLHIRSRRGPRFIEAVLNYRETEELVEVRFVGSSEFLPVPVRLLREGARRGHRALLPETVHGPRESRGMLALGQGWVSRATSVDGPDVVGTPEPASICYDDDDADQPVAWDDLFGSDFDDMRVSA